MSKVPWVLAAALAGVAVFQTIKINDLRSDVIDGALRADSLIAEADSTRRLAEGLRLEGIGLASTIALWERQAVQFEQERDELARKLQRVTAAKANLEIRLAQLEDQTNAPVAEDTTGVRSATFAGYEQPFTYNVQVDLPPPPSEGSANVQIGLDPLTLHTRITCGEPRDGVRPAFVDVAAPEWATITLTDVNQSPDVCNPGLLEAGRSPLLLPSTGFLSGAAVGFAVGEDLPSSLIGATIGTVVGFVIDRVF